MRFDGVALFDPGDGRGLVAHVTNTEVMFAMGADIQAISDGGFLWHALA